MSRLALIVLVMIGALLLSGASGEHSARAAPGMINVGVPRDFYPEYAIGPDDHPTGFGVDMMNAAAKRAGLSLTYRVFATWSETLAALERGDIDLIPLVVITPGRESRLLFTRPALTSRISIFIRQYTGEVQGMADLAGRRVGVIKGGPVTELIGKGERSPVLVQYGRLQDEMFGLLLGEVDAIIALEDSAWKLADRAQVADRLKVVGDPVMETKRAMAVRRDLPGLRDRLDAAVADLLKSPEYSSIFATWHAEPPSFWTTTRMTWLAGACTALLLLGMLLWQSPSLRAENRQREDSAQEKSPRERAPVEFSTRGISRTCGMIGLALGVAVVFAWAFDLTVLKTVLSSQSAMQPWTAITIALAGGAVLLANFPGRTAAVTYIAVASVILFIGLQMLLQHATGFEFGTDLLLFPEAVGNQPRYPHPGRPAEATCIAFATLGVVLLLGRVERAWAQLVFSIIGTGGLLLMAAVLIGYLIGVGTLQSAAFLTPVALHTALGLVVLFMGALALRPDTAWMAVLSGDGPGAASARMLLPVSILGPLFLVFLFAAGKKAGLYRPEFEIGFDALSTIALLAISLLWSAGRVDRLHFARLTATEALRESERRARTQLEELEAIYRAAPIGLALYDRDLTFVRINSALAAINGLPVEEHLGRCVWEVVPHLREAVAPHFRKVLEADETVVFEVSGEAPKAPGVRRDWMMHFYPLRGSDGSVVAVGAIVQEITERKAAEQAIRASEARLRQFIESAPVAIAMFDRDMRYIAVSRRFHLDYRLGSTSLIGRSHYEVFPEISERWREVHRRCLAGAVERSEGERFDRADGSANWVRWEVQPWRSGEGEIGGVILFGEDITDRKEAEQALYREKDRAEVTLQSIGDAVITTDAAGTITYLNPVAERLTEFDLAEAKGEPLQAVFNIINEESRKPAPDPVSRCLREGRIAGLANHTVLGSRSGKECAIAGSAAPIRDRSGEMLGAVLVFRDISETRRLTRQLQHEAAHDALTGLVNRREFEHRLKRAVTGARQRGSHHALCYFDLDQFKLVNDTAGHVAGDALLKEVRGLLAGKFRDRDTLARLGGDEFALLLDNCGLTKACRIAEIIVATFNEWRFTWRGRSFQVGASVGVVAITPTSGSWAELLTQADVACYTAKEQGRSRVHVYQGEGVNPSPHHARMLLAATLNDALRSNRFRLFGQPIVQLSGGAPKSSRSEVLLRLMGDDGEIILPDTFIPAAERYGMMAGIDRWVIDNALRARASAPSSLEHAELSINLSGESLNTDDLAAFVLSTFESYDIRPGSICFEITETAAVHNLDQALKFIQEMRRHRCRIALDDFGSGLSSFRYLRHLPIDYLKIDGSFVRNLCTNEHDEAVVAAINEVGHKLGISTVAEYVHDWPTAERLRSMNIDYGQGYLFGAPAPLTSVLNSYRHPLPMAS